MNTILNAIEAIKLGPGDGVFCRLCQHSFILKLGKAILYLDAYLTPEPGRLFFPALKATEVTDADLILGTHDHGDHIDRPAWPMLAAASPKAQFVLPTAVQRGPKPPLAGKDARRLHGLNAGESYAACGVKITAVPAAHELLDRDPKTGWYPYLGYVIEGNGVTVYHAGDCCRYEDQVRILNHWKLDAAFLPINGRDAWRLTHDCIGCMSYQEAADLAGLITPGVTVPAHYDTFPNNLEDPWLFTEYVRVKYPRLKTLVARPGEIYRFTHS